MKRLKRLLLGLLVSVLLCLPCFAESGDVTLTQSEFQTLKTALQMADKQLKESETEISNLKTRLTESQTLVTDLQTKSANLQVLLNEQDNQLETLETQLDSALKSLTKLKNATKLNNVILVIVGVIGIAVGSSITLLLVGGR